MIRQVLKIPEGLTLGSKRIKKIEELLTVKRIRRFLCLVDGEKKVIALEGKMWWIEKYNTGSANENI